MKRRVYWMICQNKKANRRAAAQMKESPSRDDDDKFDCLKNQESKPVENAMDEEDSVLEVDEEEKPPVTACTRSRKNTIDGVNRENPFLRRSERLKGKPRVDYRGMC